MHNYRKCLAGWAMLIVAVVAARAGAQEAIPPVCGTISVASYEKMLAFTTDFQLSAAMDFVDLMARSVFGTGTESLDKSRPMGFVYVVGKDTTMTTGLNILMPAADGKAGIQDLQTPASRMLPGRNDTVVITTAAGQQVVRRRTDHYVMMRIDHPEWVTEIDDKIFGPLYKSEETLAVADLNMAAIRTGSPAGFQAFFDEQRRNATKEADPVAERSRVMGQELVYSAIQSLDHLRLSVSHGTDRTRLSVSAGPCAIVGERSFPKPAFADGACLRADLVYPSHETEQRIADYLNTVIKEMGVLNGPNDTSPEAIARNKALADWMVHSVFVADAQSWALDLKDQTIYAVYQYSDDVDYATGVTQMMKYSDEIDAVAHRAPTLALKNYTAGGETINQVIWTENGRSRCLEFCQKGRTIYLAFSNDAQQRLGRIVGLPADGRISDLCDGQLDIGLMMQGLSSQMGKVAGMMTDEQMHALAAAMAGQKMNWKVGVDPAAHAMNMDFDVSDDVLRLVTRTMMPGAR